MAPSTSTTAHAEKRTRSSSSRRRWSSSIAVVSSLLLSTTAGAAAVHGRDQGLGLDIDLVGFSSAQYHGHGLERRERESKPVNASLLCNYVNFQSASRSSPPSILSFLSLRRFFGGRGVGLMGDGELSQVSLRRIGFISTEACAST